MTMTDNAPGLRESLEFDLADRLRKSLRLSGYSVAEMADYLHVDRNTVGSWINGRNTPRVSTIMVWAERTSTPFDWLWNGKITCRYLPEEGRHVSVEEEWALRDQESRPRESNPRPSHYE